jgi:hypothetical protein
MPTATPIELVDALRYAASRHLIQAEIKIVAIRTMMKVLMEVDPGRHSSGAEADENQLPNRSDAPVKTRSNSSWMTR